MATYLTEQQINAKLVTLVQKVDTNFAKKKDAITKIELLDLVAPLPSGVTDEGKYIVVTYVDHVNDTNEHKEYIKLEVGSEGGDATEMEAESLTPSAVGGIPAGTDLNGLTSLEILTMMLYPYIKPTVSATGTPNGGTFEIGDNKTITNVRVVVGKKSKKITKVEVFDGGTSLGLLNDATIENGGTFNFLVSIEVASVNKQLTASVTDEQGSEVTAKTGAFTFVYPYYVGACSDGVAIDETLVTGLTKKVESKGAKSIAYTTNNQRMVFAYPKSYGAIKSIIDPNNFDVTATFTSTTVSVTGLDGTAQDYYVYVNGASTQSNFTMKFNY